MKFKVLHRSPGRLRVDLLKDRVAFDEADILEHYLLSTDGVFTAKVYTRTGDAIIKFEEGREGDVTLALQKFRKDLVEVPDGLLEHSQRPLNNEYADRLVNMTAMRFLRRYLLPAPVRGILLWRKAWPRIRAGLRCLIKEHRVDVDVLDAAALLAALLHNASTVSLTVASMRNLLPA